VTKELHDAGGQSTLIDECWNRIGAMGDRSCPELETSVHCRNCPVFMTAGQQLFEREPSAEYLEECTRQLAEEVSDEVADTVAVVVFRLGEEWLAFDVAVVVEVAEPRAVHRIPHRSNELLTGIVNIRGELQLCISLHNLLGIAGGGEPLGRVKPLELAAAGKPEADQADPAEGAAPHELVSTLEATTASGTHASQPTGRLLVVESQQQRWAFAVDGVAGVFRVGVDQMGNVPSTVANSLKRFSRAVFTWEGRSVGCLAEDRLFDSLKGSIG
jgi:chemotaxis-related protein WspD